MPRPISNVWEHFLILCETDGKKHVTCSYCSVQYKHAMANKLKQHLLICNKCPNDVKNLYKQNNVPAILQSSPEAAASPPTCTSPTITSSSSAVAPSSSAMEPSALIPLPPSSTFNSDVSHNTLFTTQSFVDNIKNFVDDTSDNGNVLKTEELSDMESENVFENQTVEQCTPSGQSFTESTHTSWSLQQGLDSEDRREKIETLNLLTTRITKLEESAVKNNSVAIKNEFAVFGQSVAAQLTNMPFEDALQLQTDIQQLISNKRISRLSRGYENSF